MSRDSEPNINSLIQDWKRNVPLTTSGLKARGYSYQLLHRYEQSDWIVSLGKGAYARAGDTITWIGAVYTLQEDLNLPIRLGGISALNQAGYGQYLQARERVHLFGVSQKMLPRWFLRFIESGEVLLEPAGHMGPVGHEELTTLSFGEISLIGSAPELAYLEILSQVPKRISFQEAAEVAGSLNSLRSKRLQSVLEASRYVKANRLALYFGNLYSHPWRDKLVDDKINLGSGKRTIVAGGKLDSRYQIVVPGEDDVF